jgi:hypothetical protein
VDISNLDIVLSSVSRESIACTNFGRINDVSSILLQIAVTSSAIRCAWLETLSDVVLLIDVSAG